jgi:hypothetical protein
MGLRRSTTGYYFKEEEAKMASRHFEGISGICGES